MGTDFFSHKDFAYNILTFLVWLAICNRMTSGCQDLNELIGDTGITSSVDENNNILYFCQYEKNEELKESCEVLFQLNFDRDVEFQVDPKFYIIEAGKCSEHYIQELKRLGYKITIDENTGTYVMVFNCSIIDIRCVFNETEYSRIVQVRQKMDCRFGNESDSEVPTITVTPNTNPYSPSTTSTPTSSDTDNEDQASLPYSLIFGISGAAIAICTVLLIVLVLAIYYIYKHKNKNGGRSQDSELEVECRSNSSNNCTGLESLELGTEYRSICNSDDNLGQGSSMNSMIERPGSLDIAIGGSRPTTIGGLNGDDNNTPLMTPEEEIAGEERRDNPDGLQVDMTSAPAEDPNTTSQMVV